MTDPKHTNVTGNVNRIVAPKLSVTGTFNRPRTITLFDGDSVIRIHRNGALELGSKWADAGDAAAAFFAELVNRVDTAWNRRAEDTALQQRVRELEEALANARTTLAITRTNIMQEIGRCADPSESRWAGVPEQFTKRLSKIDAVLKARKALGDTYD